MIRTVPTVLISGFLGAGKTTAIRYLLANKPAGERWAVLVNEFGEIGIDGGFIQAANSHAQTVFIKEVAGGCICCTAGLPVQIALSQLLQQAKPDRLIIESTGLGHPQQIIETLRKQFHPAIAVQGIITLVDARQITDPRYAGHAIFVQQLQAADVIVASKADSYDAGDMDFLHTWLAAQQLAEKPLYSSSGGNIQLGWLGHIGKPVAEKPLAAKLLTATTPRLFGTLPASVATPAITEHTHGFYHKQHAATGYSSAGWVFAAPPVFDMALLLRLLDSINAERIKGIVRSREGVCSFNKAGNTLHAGELELTVEDSRIEIISSTALDWHALDKQLRACLVK